jgi:hypothetical protein
VIEDTVVVAKGVVREKVSVGAIVEVPHQRDVRGYEAVRVGKMVAEKIKEEVTGFAVEREVHGSFAEEIFQGGVDNGEGTEAVPEIVEDKDTAAGALAASGNLILASDERAPKFNGTGKVVLNELIGEPKKVRGSKARLPVTVQTDIGAAEKTVAAEDTLFVGRPDDKLPVTVRHGVVGINIAGITGTTPVGTESSLPETADLPHNVGRVIGGDDVKFVT